MNNFNKKRGQIIAIALILSLNISYTNITLEVTGTDKNVHLEKKQVGTDFVPNIDQQKIIEKTLRKQ